MTSVQDVCTIVTIVIVISIPLVATSMTAQATSTSSYSNHTTKSQADLYQDQTLNSSSGLNYEIEFGKNGTMFVNVRNQKDREIRHCLDKERAG